MQEFVLLSKQMRFMSTLSKITPYSALHRLVCTCQSYMHKDVDVHQNAPHAGHVEHLWK